jgi:hypothetical protein
VTLQEWITHGKEPPRSLYPTLGRGSLVPVKQNTVPYIPAVNFTLSGLFAQRFHLDRGPDFDETDVSSVMDEPPVENIRKAGFSEGDSCDLTRAFIPFFKTKAEHDAAGDSRLSLAERYPTHTDYVAKVTAAANQLVKQRLLLQQDADMIISQANAAAVP